MCGSGLITALLVCSQFAASQAFIEGLYCGTENCYEVLGVGRDALRPEIAKAYRRLAKKYHPDMHRDPADKEKFEKKFQVLATAYETLRDDEVRKEYDYMLDNPDEVYRHYYYYYRRRVAPQVDVRLVIAVTITVISVVQYYSMWNNYKTAIQYLATVPKYRIKAVDIAKKEGLLDPNSKKNRRRPKEEVKEEEEAIIRSVIEGKMDIKGGYQKPDIYSVLWLQIVFFPLYTGQYFIWLFRWFWRFKVKKEEYGEEEKFYLIRRHMGMSQTQFESLEDTDKEKFLHLQLWKTDKYKTYKQEQEEEMKRKLAENPRYRAYRRYMKNHGPGQISFVDE